MMDQTGESSGAPAGSSLEQLKRYTKVVADTGDFASIRSFAPVDATTNPTLILKAVQMEEYEYLLERAVAESEGAGLEGAALVSRTALRLLTLFGGEILKIIPGRVSTEVDARLSFDTDATVAQAREVIALYAADDVPKERVLIKVAATWEGIKAAEVLEREGIHCNLTLLFSMPQAVACAEAGVTLISPFVGRILDWYKTNTGRDYAGAEDPGVQSVHSIYNYYKHYGYDTEVMGASFRNSGEIVELAGCDLLTISPPLLAELSASSQPVERRLSPELARGMEMSRLPADEASFRWLLNADPMATEKLAQGIRSFAADVERLEDMIEAELLDEHAAGVERAF